MRSGVQQQRLVIGGRGQLWQVETMRHVGNGASRPRSKSGKVEGQTVAQQFKPLLLGRPQRLGMGRVFRDRIMADADWRSPGYESPDRIPVGPSALGKQQVQLCVMGALRL